MASHAPRSATLTPAAVPAVRLSAVPAIKPWGRHDLGRWGACLGADPVAGPIGEIHHRLDGDDDPELFVKTLFTGERLSVQVHPDAAAARARGHRRGKDEAWVVLAADPGATIGLGLKAAATADLLRAAALDGSIVDLMHWHRCVPGDVFFTPAGTIHAIGSGVTLFEVQQNLDLTYRLHDYGRPRELHLDEALMVADLSAWKPPAPPLQLAAGHELLVAGPGFVLERVQAGRGRLTPPATGPLWVSVIDGSIAIGDGTASVGDVWQVTAPVEVTGQGLLLLAYAGADPVRETWRLA
jgi:mannose-6-phosphate isomerase